MFGARKGGEGEPGPETLGRSESPRSESLTVSTPRTSEVSIPSPRIAPRGPDRIIDIPSQRPSSRRAAPSSSHDQDIRGDSGRTLKVGKGLSVAGEITSCDILVVEGKVEAKLNDGKMLEITESGQFRGSVEIENADIAGRYDGQLVVHGRLTIRSTGRVSGMVKYGELEVNAGGQIIGELQVAGATAAGNPTASLKSAGKFGSFAEDTEEESTERSGTPRSSERRSA
jgi:cytoskeletal protein CcmA (bactofilin family)